MELVKMSDIQSGKQSSTPSPGIVPMSAVSKSSSGLVPMSQVAVRAPAADPSESIDAILQSQHGAEQEAGVAPQPYSNDPYVPAPDQSLADKVQHENFLDWIFKTNPVARVLNRPFAAAAADSIPDAPYLDQPGTNARQDYLQRNPIASTGSPMVDKAADYAGGMGSMFVPIGGASPIINDLSKVTGALGSTKVGQAIEDLAGKAGFRAANTINPALNNLGIDLSTNLAQKAGQNFVKGAALGGLYGATAPFTYGDGSSADVPGSMASNALMFGAADAALPFIGAGLKRAAQPLVDRNDFKQAIDEFIQRTQAADTADVPSAYSSAAKQGLVQEAPKSITPMKDLQTGQDLAATFDRGEKYNQAYRQAVNDQYTFLKQSMENRGGVNQGGMIKDPTTGEVVNRYGRISNNPPWYQDFFKVNGKKPSDTELRALAEQHVKEGFNDVGGRIPPWKPDEFHNIDEEIKHINELLPHADAQTAASLQETVKTLEQSRGEYGRSLPEGIQAMRSAGTLKGQAPNKPITFESGQTGKSKYDAERQQFNAEQQNYEGNRMPFRDGITQSERTINRNKVISNMRKNLGLTIDTGRLGPGMKNVLGIFKTTPEVIRSGMAEDIQTISHEAGHALDKRFHLSEELRKNDRMMNELYGLLNYSGHDLKAYEPHQHASEGVAEFTRLYLTDRKEAIRLAPDFTKYFKSKLSSRALRGIEKTTRDIDTWITQGPENQAKGLIDFDSHKQKPPVFSWDTWYTNQIDDLNPFKLAEKALTGKLGIGKDSIWKMAHLSRGIAERAKLAITDGIFDAKGKKVSDGLRQIVKPVEEAGFKEKDLAVYLAVKQAMDLKALGKRVPFTDDQINAIMQKFDTPLMQQAQQKIVGWNNALLDIAVEAELKSQEAVDAMREKYPNYVPFMRHFDADIEAGFKNGGFGASSAFANITDPIKRMSEEGSYRTIINPVESMAKNAFLIMNAAAKNKVGLQLAELSKIDGAGKWVEKVPGASSPTEHIVNVWENGQRQAYKINNPELYSALLSLDNESSISIIRFLGGAVGVLRAGSTLTPEFTVRNATRDTLEAFIKVGFHPVDFARGLVHVIGKTDTFNHFLSQGGAMGTMMALDRESLQRDAMSKIFRESLKDKALNVITSPKELAKMFTGITPAKKVIGALRHGAEVSELSTKVGTFSKVLKKTGSAEEAAYTAKDLMNFNRAGRNVRQTNRIVAFLNSSIQGTDGMIRSFKQNPAGFMARAGVGLVLPTIANFIANENLSPENKQIFDNIPQWQKVSYLVVHIPGTSDFARIPKPFEMGTIFSTGTERILRALVDQDPEAFKNYGSALLQAMTPPIMISLFTPLLEAITNHSFFKNTPIVSQTYDRFEKQDQYDPITTSETAKLIGKGASAVGLGKTNTASPLIIDNTIRGYTGGLGQYAVSGLDKILNAMGVGGDTPKPAKKWDESMFLKPFLASTAGGGQIRSDFYSKWDDLSHAKSSADLNDEPFTDPMYVQMKNAKSTIDKQLRDYKRIKLDKTMNSEEKRRQLDNLDAIINQVAAQGLGK